MSISDDDQDEDDNKQAVVIVWLKNGEKGENEIENGPCMRHASAVDLVVVGGGCRVLKGWMTTLLFVHWMT